MEILNKNFCSRTVSKILRCFGFFCILAFCQSYADADADVAVRSSVGSTDHISNSSLIWVAVDFSVPNGEHVTAPIGKGTSLSPKFNWKNAKVIDVIWPDPIDLPPDNAYKGYSKNFTILFSIMPNNCKLPISCELFYVLCGDSCKPVDNYFTVKHNKLLTESEIYNARNHSSSNTGFLGFLLILGMTFLGGIILNCMPCVFPILSIKIFSIIKNHEVSKKILRKQGMMFMLGSILTFLSIGITLFLLKGLGINLGWGFYMQSPAFVVALLLIFLLCALYFFGIYTIPGFNIIKKSKKEHSIYIQSFVNGVFTSIASGTCVGPFIGVAIASALIYENIFMCSLVFISLGLGVAAPFMTACLIPNFGKILPRPGKWMETLKEVMGFAMLFSCIWVFWILSGQIEISKLMIIFACVSIFSFFVWMLEKLKNTRYAKFIAIVGACLSVYFMISQIYTDNDNLKTENSTTWTDFSFDKFAELKKEGNPIFLNFTASWCLTCNINSSTLKKQSVIDIFKKHNVTYIKVDWSNRNESIAKALSLFSSNSVPLNIFYKTGTDKPIVLPSILTENNIIGAIEK